MNINASRLEHDRLTAARYPVHLKVNKAASFIQTNMYIMMSEEETLYYLASSSSRTVIGLPVAEPGR